MISLCSKAADLADTLNATLRLEGPLVTRPFSVPLAEPLTSPGRGRGFAGLLPGQRRRGASPHATAPGNNPGADSSIAPR